LPINIDDKEKANIIKKKKKFKKRRSKLFVDDANVESRYNFKFTYNSYNNSTVVKKATADDNVFDKFDFDYIFKYIK